MVEAAEILGVTERTSRQWSTRDEAEGIEGLEDRQLDQASTSPAPIDEALPTMSRPKLVVYKSPI